MSYDLRFQTQTKSFNKRLIKRLVIFTNNKCKFNIDWNKILDHFFKLKTTFNTRAVLFMKVIVCVVKNMSEIGEPVRKVLLRWAEHEDRNKQSELAKH